MLLIFLLILWLWNVGGALNQTGKIVGSGSAISHTRIRCLENSIGIELDNIEGWDGRIYARKNGNDPNCVKHYSEFEKRITLDIPFNFLPCGIKSKRMQHPRSGLEYTLTVIVSKDHTHMTEDDQMFTLSCRYYSNYKDVGTVMEVSTYARNYLVGGQSGPSCEYSLRYGSLNGPPAQNAKIGDKVFHEWKCADSSFAFKVYDCFVHDGADKKYKLIDEEGCSKDKTIIPDLTYDPSLNFAFAASRVFKFAESTKMFFNCLLYMCPKSDPACQQAVPPRCSSRSKRSAVQTLFTVNSTLSAPKNEEFEEDELSVNKVFDIPNGHPVYDDQRYYQELHSTIGGNTGINFYAGHGTGNEYRRGHGTYFGSRPGTESNYRPGAESNDRIATSLSSSLNGMPNRLNILDRIRLGTDGTSTMDDMGQDGTMNIERSTMPNTVIGGGSYSQNDTNTVLNNIKSTSMGHQAMNNIKDSLVVHQGGYQRNADNVNDRYKSGYNAQDSHSTHIDEGTGQKLDRTVENAQRYQHIIHDGQYQTTMDNVGKFEGMKLDNDKTYQPVDEKDFREHNLFMTAAKSDNFGSNNENLGQSHGEYQQKVKETEKSDLPDVIGRDQHQEANHNVVYDPENTVNNNLESTVPPSSPEDNYNLNHDQVHGVVVPPSHQIEKDELEKLIQQHHDLFHHNEGISLGSNVQSNDESLQQLQNDDTVKADEFTMASFVYPHIESKDEKPCNRLKEQFKKVVMALIIGNLVSLTISILLLARFCTRRHSASMNVQLRGYGV
ncbi:unnamed protein product [Bursaphelenchus okinawaensis]|uniref:ZP domain-containing protein n=1 Tax=Bursaphelenchus okinawaensis TaxID=465554 RepID=A0A811L424_9BILA|nr:unnamed protein product [Bursaphelenchus okinawaensis]CAG9116912.1 unnamed protein product [Bursaphelenchus okinawaensis]